MDLFEPLESQKQASFVCLYSVFAHFESHEQKKFMNVFCFFVFFLSSMSLGSFRFG